MDVVQIFIDFMYVFVISGIKQVLEKFLEKGFDFIFFSIFVVNEEVFNSIESVDVCGDVLFESFIFFESFILKIVVFVIFYYENVEFVKIVFFNSEIIVRDIFLRSFLVIKDVLESIFVKIFQFQL